MNYEIVPQERVKQKLDRAIHAKNKKWKWTRSIQIAAAACVLFIVGFGIFFVQKTITKNHIVALTYHDSIRNEEIVSVLQNLGRIEARSSSIIADNTIGIFEKFDTTAINTEFEL